VPVGFASLEAVLLLVSDGSADRLSRVVGVDSRVVVAGGLSSVVAVGGASDLVARDVVRCVGSLLLVVALAGSVACWVGVRSVALLVSPEFALDEDGHHNTRARIAAIAISPPTPMNNPVWRRFSVGAK
jgi:hypothetical protein